MGNINRTYLGWEDIEIIVDGVRICGLVEFAARILAWQLLTPQIIDPKLVFYPLFQWPKQICWYFTQYSNDKNKSVGILPTIPLTLTYFNQFFVSLPTSGCLVCFFLFRWNRHFLPPTFWFDGILRIRSRRFVASSDREKRQQW